MEHPQRTLLPRDKIFKCSCGLSKTLTETEYEALAGDPPKATITPCPSSPLDLPNETFQNALERREKNRISPKTKNRKKSGAGICCSKLLPVFSPG
jgi:hypothetical protein